MRFAACFGLVFACAWAVSGDEGEGSSGKGPRAAIPASFPFTDGFESGPLGSHWEVTGTGNFRTEVTGSNSPHSGSFHLQMDTSGSAARNELTLFIDLTGELDVELRFWHKEFSDEDHDMAATFTDGADADGVAISEDGVTWHKVQGLIAADGVNGNWTEFVVDLDAAAAAAEIAFNDQFQIRFNHYDDLGIPTDGFAFDDISVDSVIDEAPFPFFESFESGTLEKHWVSTGTNNFRTQVSSSNEPYAGMFHVTMDSSSSGLSRNALTLYIDLSSATQPVLQFRHKEFGDEDHAMPATFVDDSDSDGVAISEDGVNWHKVQGLIGSDGISGDWTEFNVDLAAAAEDAEIAFGRRFQIRFNQYDNLSIPTDGFAFDDILVYETGAGPLKATDPSPANAASEQALSTDLQWSDGGGALSYNVFFGTNPVPGGNEFQGNQSSTTFDPGPLSADTVYHWRIDSVNPGGTTTGDVWTFITAVAPPLEATNPSPGNGAVNQSTATDVSWTDGGGATMYDVYFGFDATPDATEFQGDQSATTFDPGPLSEGVTYYWRIDSVNSGGTTTGTVWSFSTVPLAPLKAVNPSPANGAADESVSTDLSWGNGGGATTYDVFFGTDATPDATEFQGNQAGTTFDPGPLSAGTPYYWRIDSRNSGGVAVGDVWTFTTEIVPLVDVWVDGNHVGVENGTQANPFRTVTAGMQYLLSGGTLHIVAGEYPETLNVSTPANLTAEEGVVRIGSGVAPRAGGGAGWGIDKEEDKGEDKEEDGTLGDYFWTAEEIARLLSGIAGSERRLTYETAMPYAETEDGERMAGRTQPIALRLLASEPFNLDSFWGEAPAAFRDTTRVSWMKVDDEGRDVWVVFAPETGWDMRATGDASLVLRAGGVTKSGVPATGGPFAFTIADLGESRTARLVPAVSRDSHVHGAGPVFQVEPHEAFSEPHRMWVPVPDGIDLAGLRLFYFKTSGHDAGWYPAEHVVGFLASFEPIEATLSGTRYLGFDIRHAGVVQLVAR